MIIIWRDALTKVWQPFIWHVTICFFLEILNIKSCKQMWNLVEQGLGLSGKRVVELWILPPIDLPISLIDLQISMKCCTCSFMFLNTRYSSFLSSRFLSTSSTEWLFWFPSNLVCISDKARHRCIKLTWYWFNNIKVLTLIDPSAIAFWTVTKQPMTRWTSLLASWASILCFSCEPEKKWLKQLILHFLSLSK